MVVALYPGRFDPVTYGHIDIAARASKLFDSVVIGVAYSRSTIFSLDERMSFFSNALDELIKTVFVPSCRSFLLSAKPFHFCLNPVTLEKSSNASL